MKVRPLFYEMRVECAWCGKYLCMSKCVNCPGCSEQLLAESEEYQAAIRARENESLSLTV